MSYCLLSRTSVAKFVCLPSSEAAGLSFRKQEWKTGVKIFPIVSVAIGRDPSLSF
ncbi:hypothetical protein [Leptospira alexanderi]|uniref:Uncharacterized protein n=2 Tax=Leptospira alexanderi TaxID=100053 RepID=V6I2G2_9LEPT|nr:hypothetical protein [Leptospira alexanderi]EQA64405.1 hypothetical protein LEP1GSC062_0376 [Leptospira alexanderi serovar Manhao 3 str. L 60]